MKNDAGCTAFCVPGVITWTPTMYPKPKLYRSPINLPESSSGPISIKHRVVNDEVPIVGMRQALLTGQRQTVAQLTAPLRVHELHHTEHGLWMTDLPEELNQIGVAMQIFRPYGGVLVGGLGLGILAKTLAGSAVVGAVTVI